MHFNIKDITGQKFNRWTVMMYLGRSYWLCRCDCGTEKAVFTGNLKNNKSISCGCFRDERASISSRTHGLTKSDEYKVWAGMKRRCLNQHEKSYERYGGRGITICQRWADSFEAFLEDMGKRPSKEHSIDRIDNTKGYEPANCRWATRLEQMRNMTTNHRITFRDVTKTISEWASLVPIKAPTIAFRLNTGWSVERALTEPVKIGKNQFSKH